MLNTEPMNPFALLKEQRKSIIAAMIIFIISLITIFFTIIQPYWDDKRLENAVYEDIQEQVGDTNFTIDHIKEMGYVKPRGNHISVGYHIEGSKLNYWAWYFWKNGELTHDFTLELENKEG